MSDALDELAEYLRSKKRNHYYANDETPAACDRWLSALEQLRAAAPAPPAEPRVPDAWVYKYVGRDPYPPTCGHIVRGRAELQGKTLDELYPGGWERVRPLYAAPAAEPVAQQPPPLLCKTPEEIGAALDWIATQPDIPEQPEAPQAELTPRVDALLLETNEGRRYATEGPLATLARNLEAANARLIRDANTSNRLIGERCEQLEAELAASRERERALEADARRYRWLQAHDMRLPDAAIAHACHHPLTDAEVDRYIDAAIAEQAKEQQR